MDPDQAGGKQQALDAQDDVDVARVRRVRTGALREPINMLIDEGIAIDPTNNRTVFS